VRSAEAAWEAAQDIGVPVVLKPYNGNHGRGVSLNLSQEEEIKAAYNVAVERGNGSSSVIVEKYIRGAEHRLLVVGKQVVAAACGESLWITGDGTSTIDQLCWSQINDVDPRRGRTEEFPLNVVVPSESKEVLLELQRVGLTPDSVPAAGRRC